MEAANPEEMSAEFGDLLFSLVNYGRKLGIDPEEALTQTVRRFESRFRFAEASARDSGTNLGDLSDQERDELWESAKRSTTTAPGTIDPKAPEG
jgi:XTP/dITP diphosphohydrolase